MRIFFKPDTFCLSILSVVLLVCFEVQTWALAFSVGLLAIRFGAEKKIWPNPHQFWSNVLAVVALGLVIFEFRTFLGQEPSSTFLVILVSVRILDFRTERDARLLLLLGFVLVSIKFLYSLDLYWLPAGIAIFLGLWRSLLPDDLARPWKTTFKMALKSLPVVALLFFLFPRIQVPWVRTNARNIEIVGFSESISPGDIANVAKTRDIVMRAEFINYRPRLLDLYWRGAVLEDTDGFGWKRSAIITKNIPIPPSGLAYDYVVTLEPLQMKALPVLEHTKMISAPNLEAVKTDRAVFRSLDPVKSRIRYQGAITDTWSGPALPNPTDLPRLPPKTQAWVTEKLKLKLEYQGTLKLLKDFFQTGNFEYTLSPGLHEDLDEFLFSRRVGFCEHFAGAYAVLARALGVPARVITGYQGGEWNNAGDFIRVTQADAHAWVEVLDPKGFWRRVDPTAWIAPLRMELGANAYFRLSPADLQLGALQALERIRNQDRWGLVWDQFQSQVETLNYLWTRTLLEFDLSEQQKLLEYFAPQIGWWLAILVLLFVAYQGFFYWYRSQKNYMNTASFYYSWLERKLSAFGFNRKLHQPPLEFLRQVAESRPQDRELVQKTIMLYQFELYKERPSGPDDWRRLKREWTKRLKRSTSTNTSDSR